MFHNGSPRRLLPPATTRPEHALPRPARSPTKCLRQLVLPPDDCESQRDPPTPAIRLPRELLRPLVQHVPQARALALLRRERALRRGELRVQRGRRRCVASGERLERLL